MKTKELRIFAIVISIFVLFAFASCQTSQAESPWYKTWREASEKAEETEQNILVFFSKVGVDEEGKPLDEASYALNNSFSKKSFKKKVAENYVLLNIDFSDPSGIDYSEYMEYMDFLNKFTIQSIPAIIIATPEQYVVGYVQGDDMDASPSKIISKIASFNKASKNVTKARKSLEQAEGLERLSAIDELITALSPAYRYLVVDLLSEIKESDPENETGLLTKYALSFAYVDAIGEFGQGNTQGAIDIFLNVAETEGVSTEDAQEAYMTACYLMSNSGIASPELVLETMRKALALDPNSKMADNIKKSIEYMEGYLTSIAEMDDSSDENADEAEVPSTEVSSENE